MIEAEIPAERLVVQNELDTYTLGGQSLRAWHQFLTTDQYTGEPSGHLETPGSRYGRNGEQCAWWAIAGYAAYSYATDDDHEPAQSMAHFMGMAVNDVPLLAELVHDFRWVVPDELDGMLDWERANT
jgi:hypothetical protein